MDAAEGDTVNARARFVRMQDSTAEDWKVIAGEFMPFAQALPGRVVKHLQILQGDHGGFPVDRYAHSLQTATRALRDGRDEEYVICALLHDIGDTLGSFNHPDIAAAILKPFVSEENHWMVQNHGIFQGYHFFHHLGLDRDMREQFAGHALYGYTAEFCDLYDAPAFATPAAIVPTPREATSFTPIRAAGLIARRSAMSCARSSIE